MAEKNRLFIRLIRSVLEDSSVGLTSKDIRVAIMDKPVDCGHGYSLRRKKVPTLSEISSLVCQIDGVEVVGTCGNARVYALEGEA